MDDELRSRTIRFLVIKTVIVHPIRTALIILQCNDKPPKATQPMANERRHDEKFNQCLMGKLDGHVVLPSRKHTARPKNAEQFEQPQQPHHPAEGINVQMSELMLVDGWERSVQSSKSALQRTERPLNTKGGNLIQYTHISAH